MNSKLPPRQADRSILAVLGLTFATFGLARTFGGLARTFGQGWPATRRFILGQGWRWAMLGRASREGQLGCLVQQVLSGESLQLGEGRHHVSVEILAEYLH